MFDLVCWKHRQLLASKYYRLFNLGFAWYPYEFWFLFKIWHWKESINIMRYKRCIIWYIHWLNTNLENISFDFSPDYSEFALPHSHAFPHRSLCPFVVKKKMCPKDRRYIYLYGEWWDVKMFHRCLCLGPSE